MDETIMILLNIHNTEQIRQVYRDYLTKDFPPSERKTLEMIEEYVRKGVYECLGLFEEDKIIGYAFLVRMGKVCLVDYLAVVPEKRDQGVGGKLLNLLGTYLRDEDAVIGEVEIPAEAENEEEQLTRTRRLNFYLRNGLIDTGVNAVCFGVPFEILRFDNGRELTMQDVCSLYEKIYRFLLPPGWFEDNIFILPPCADMNQTIAKDDRSS